MCFTRGDEEQLWEIQVSKKLEAEEANELQG